MDAIKTQYIKLNPEARSHLVEAAVLRLTYQHKLKNHQIQLHNKMGKGKFKPDLSKTQKMKPGYRYHHSGKWQENKFAKEDDEKMCWSCCMNYKWDSEGCVKVKEDKNAWNLISY